MFKEYRLSTISDSISLAKIAGANGACSIVLIGGKPELSKDIDSASELLLVLHFGSRDHFFGDLLGAGAQ
jgi:hypothetical protein